MSILLEKYLSTWPKAFIRDQDIQAFFLNNNSRRYDAVKYAVRKGYLIKIKRGLYMINLPHKKLNYDPYEIAQAIYSSSYISLESALSYYGWIPEAVYTTTSVTSQRSKNFNTSIGDFSFAHTPTLYFYDEVNRIESEDAIFLIAEPWKAVADYIYVYKKDWLSIENLYSDLRIEIEVLRQSDLSSLKKISNHYDSKRVKTIFDLFLMELK